jgi:hypothetical protein
LAQPIAVPPRRPLRSERPADRPLPRMSEATSGRSLCRGRPVLAASGAGYGAVSQGRSPKWRLRGLNPRFQAADCHADVTRPLGWLVAAWGGDNRRLKLLPLELNSYKQLIGGLYWQRPKTTATYREGRSTRGRNVYASLHHRSRIHCHRGAGGRRVSLGTADRSWQPDQAGGPMLETPRRRVRPSVRQHGSLPAAREQLCSEPRGSPAQLKALRNRTSSWVIWPRRRLWGLFATGAALHT